MKIIQDAYFGIHFPNCFFRFQDFVEQLKINHNIDINRCGLQIQLGDIFQVFQPDFESKFYNPVVTSRYPNDPPEFLTIIHGSSDGLHWGYYLEDPNQPEFIVASYFHRDPLLFSIDGLNLFEAFRKILEKSYEDNSTYQKMYGDQEYQKILEELNSIRNILKTYYTQEREEVGEEYLQKYQYVREVSTPTRDGMGIVLSKELYCPIHDVNNFLKLDFTPTPEQVDRYMKEALELCDQGIPGTALKLGKDLWCYEQYKKESYQLLEMSYKALNRRTLSKFLNLAKGQTN